MIREHFPQFQAGCTLLQASAVSKHCNQRASKAVDLFPAASWPTVSTVQRAETMLGARGAARETAIRRMKSPQPAGASPNRPTFSSTGSAQHIGPNPSNSRTQQEVAPCEAQRRLFFSISEA